MVPTVVFVYDARNGKLLGIVEPDRRIFGMAGAWIDQSGGLRAFTKKNGEVMLLVEDSGWGKGYVFTLPAQPLGGAFCTTMAHPARNPAFAVVKTNRIWRRK